MSVLETAWLEYATSGLNAVVGWGINGLRKALHSFCWPSESHLCFHHISMLWEESQQLSYSEFACCVGQD